MCISYGSSMQLKITCKCVYTMTSRYVSYFVVACDKWSKLVISLANFTYCLPRPQKVQKINGHCCLCFPSEISTGWHRHLTDKNYNLFHYQSVQVLHVTAVTLIRYKVLAKHDRKTIFCLLSLVKQIYHGMEFDDCIPQRLARRM